MVLYFYQLSSESKQYGIIPVYSISHDYQYTGILLYGSNSTKKKKNPFWKEIIFPY